MNQHERSAIDAKPWVLLSSMSGKVDPADVARVVPQIQNIVDDWQSPGRVMWSGPLDNETSGMAIFEANEREARGLFDRYRSICDGVLDCFLYQWDAMPILTLLSQK